MRKPLGHRGANKQYKDPTAKKRRVFDEWRDRQRDKMERRNNTEAKAADNL